MEIKIITDFFATYGWQLTLLALSGIVVLGCLKWFGAFKKVNSNIKKYLYFGLSCLFSIIACTIYLLVIGGFEWMSYLILCGAVFGLTIVVYHIYEHTGIRALWNKVLDLIAKLFKFIVSSILSKTLTKEALTKKAVNLGSAVLVDLVKQAKENENKARLEEASKKD